MTVAPLTHPVLACAETMTAALKDVADVDPVFMRTEDKATALTRLGEVSAQVEELRLRVLAESADVAEGAADRDAAAWLARSCRIDGKEARRQQRLARSLGQRQVVARALRQGSVNPRQAEAIVHALDELPDDVEPAVREAAEQRLVEEAARFGPRELRVMGRRVLDVMAPDVADEQERRALEREEAHASSVTQIRTRSRGDGTSDTWIRASDAVTNRFLTYLEAYASPRRPDGRAAINPDDRRPYPQLLGHAFVSFLEAVDPKRLPLHGGTATTVVVTIDHETLLQGLRDSGVALVGDEPISASEARRLACNATLIPLVLGGDSVPLDQGRAKRFFEGRSRDVLAATQHTCRAEGCDIPAVWCEAHHGNGRWVDGAGTNLIDAILLCPFHHHRAHDRRYDMTRLPDGRVRFNRRT